jgi:hypothetical protein
VNPPARLRMSRTALLPVAVLTVCAVPIAAVLPWGPLVLLLPIAAAAWVLRVGLDIGDEGLTVRSVLGSRRVAWTELAGIRVAARGGGLWLVTTYGTDVRVPVMRARVLPRLAALSGGRLDDPAPPSQ